MIIFSLKNIRLNKKVTLYKLSQLTGLSRTYLRNLENNKNINPTLNSLERIANALDINIKDLFYTSLDIEELKQKLHKSIKETSINSKEVIEISQLIDLLINIKMKEELDN